MPAAPRYRTIVADPPWAYDDPFGGFNTGSRLSSRRPLAYASMTHDEIKTLPVDGLAAPDANLFLWTTNRHLPAAFAVVEAWGFTYRQLLIWHKTGANPNTGSIAPTSCEFLLFARRGKAVATQKLADALVSTKRLVGSHSRKPDVFLDLIESVSPGPYLEMFARRQRLGWDTWGNEALNHVEMAS